MLPDGSQLWWQRIAPRDEPPRSVVVFVHDFADHSDFALFGAAKSFVQHTGCAALLVDMPGHGRSDGLHGLLPPWPRLVEALGGWCDAVCGAERGRGRAGGKLPLFAFGWSAGATVAIGLALRRPEDFSGLLLSAPALQLAPGLRPHLLDKAALWLLGHLPVLEALPLLRLSGLDLSELGFAPDAAWRLEEHVRVNALQYRGRLRPRAVRALLAAAGDVASRFDAIGAPLLVLHGAADRMAPPEASQELVRRANSTDKTFQLVPGGEHGLHFGDTIATMQEVYAIMFEWLNRRHAVSEPLSTEFA